MPQIPGLPTVEPVAEPKAKPGLFASSGEAVADLGQESEQLAAHAADVEYGIAQANRQLKAKQAEIAFGRAKLQVYDALRKSTTAEQAQQVYENSRKQLDSTLAPYETDRQLARELGIYRQQEDVEIQHTLNARKATIITESDRAANATIAEDKLNKAITTKVGGGDPTTDREQMRLQIQSSVAHGTMTPAEADEFMQVWDKKYEKGVILAKINSGDPATRQYAIKQLSAGGDELEHSKLSAEEIDQLRTHAVDTDHSLTEKEEAGNLNNALNIKAEAFSSPEFKHPDGTPDYEARESALQDSDWLKSHGIVTPDGKPNYVMAEKMQEDDARQWNMHQKVQRDKDEEVLEKYSPRIYDPKHPMTIAEIENLPQTEHASSRAVNQLKTALFQEQRNARVLRNEERSLSLQERQEKRRELEDRSTLTSLNLADRMSKGDVLDYNNDILTPISKGQMTEADGAKVWRMYKDSDQFPQIGQGIGIIGEVYKALPNNPDNNRKYDDAISSFRKAVQEKNLHGGDILKEAQSIAEQTGKAETTNILQNFFKWGWAGGSAPGASTTQAAPAKTSQGRAVMKDGKVIGYTTDGKTMTPVEAPAQ